MVNKRHISIWVIIVIAIMGSNFVMPKPANAQATGAACALGGALSQYITSKITSYFSSKGGDTVPTSDAKLIEDSGSQLSKAFTLDHIASCAAKEILHQMTVSTVNWINSGFNGSPSYVTDPKGFLLDAADQLTGEMLSNEGVLKSLCSPWNVDVRLTLALDQVGLNNRRYTCTISKIIGNAKNATVNGSSLEGFLGGDFSQGGWPAFISMTTEPQNNPYGSYLSANSDLNQSIGVRKSGISLDLTAGAGFLSWQECEDVPPADPNSDVLLTRKCTTKTPGSVIAHTLNTHSDAGVVETEMANDINSVVSALLTQLTSQMLTKGLHSLSSSGSGVSNNGLSSLDSYVSQLQNDANSGQISTAYTTAVNIIASSKSNYQAALACFQSIQAQSSSAVSTFTATSTVQSQINAISSAIDGQVTPLLSSLTSKQSIASSGGTSISNATANADLANAQTQAAKFNLDAQQYMTACQAMTTQ